jgi:hypothetical protein
MKERYENELTNAKNRLKSVEDKINETHTFLKTNPDDAMQLNELRQLALNKLITLNEIEHIQNNLDAFDI